MARIIAPQLAKFLNQEVVVENFPGAGGMVGMSRAARAAPDGYTIVVGSRSATIDMTLYKKPTYNLKNDLAPVILIAEQPTVLVVRRDLPANTLREFVAYVKNNASTIRMGSAGVGATGYVDCAIFNAMFGVSVPAIPYRGSGPAMQDLIAGQLDYLCTLSGTASGPIQDELIKGLAVFYNSRVTSMPGVPTAHEQGVQFDASTWFGLFAPAATPPEIIAKIHDAAAATIALPIVRDQFASIGTYVVPLESRSTAYFQGIIGPEIEKNAIPLRANGISVD